MAHTAGAARRKIKDWAATNSTRVCQCLGLLPSNQGADAAAPRSIPRAAAPCRFAMVTTAGVHTWRGSSGSAAATRRPSRRQAMHMSSSALGILVIPGSTETASRHACKNPPAPQERAEGTRNKTLVQNRSRLPRCCQRPRCREDRRKRSCFVHLGRGRQTPFGDKPQRLQILLNPSHASASPPTCYGMAVSAVAARARDGCRFRRAR